MRKPIRLPVFQLDALRTSSLTIDPDEASVAALQPLAYSVESLAVATTASRSALYEAIADGSLPAKKMGSRTVVIRSAAVAWLERLPDAVHTKKAKEDLKKEPNHTPIKNGRPA